MYRLCSLKTNKTNIGIYFGPSKIGKESMSSKKNSLINKSQTNKPGYF